MSLRKIETVRKNYFQCNDMFSKFWQNVLCPPKKIQRQDLINI